MSIRNRFTAALCVLSFFAFAGSLWAQAAPKEAPKAVSPAMDQRALDLLKKMSDTISDAKTVSFHSRSMTPLKSPAGIWVNLYSDARVIMQQPDMLFAETRGDFNPYDFYYNGKTITAYAPDKNLYAEKPAAPSIDEMIENAYKEEGKSFPYADILISEPYAVMTKGLEKAFYVGRSTIANIETIHLEFVSKNVEWQIWIGLDDNLPRLVCATYLDEINEPSYTVEFFNWKINEPVPADTFVFSNKTGASKIEFRVPSQPAVVSGAMRK